MALLNVKNFESYSLDEEFESILEGLRNVNEEQTGPYTFEWDLTKKSELEDLEEETNPFLDKLKKFLAKIPKDKIKAYFIKLMNRLKSIPAETRRKIIVNCLHIFLLFTSITALVPDNEPQSEPVKIDIQIKKEIKAIFRESKFEEAQSAVKQVEAGYSDDRDDTGNYVEVKNSKGKIIKRFVGTNHGISAPVLKDYLGRVPKAEDMIKLSYKDALEIFKNDYWDKQNLQMFADQNVANILYDGCVNQGVNRMMEIMDKCIQDFDIKAPLGNPFNSKIVKKE